MSKVLIIGAGCSKNYSQSTTRITGLECPLDRDFFKMAKKVIAQHEIDPIQLPLVEMLIDDLRRLYGYEQFYPNMNPSDNSMVHFKKHDSTYDDFLKVLDDNRLSLEKVFTQLSLEKELFLRLAPYLGYSQNDQNDFSDLLAPLVELIAVTISKALEGPFCLKHLKLANSLRNGDAVVSFNYDLLMDNALVESNRLTDCGYYLPFQQILKDGVWTTPDQTSSPVSLLKLHGSMNWLHCINCNSYLLTRLRKIGSWDASLPKSCPICHVSGSFERVIIPPILSKKYSSHPYDYLWRQASNCISKAREIVIIGYSFPPTDFASELLLRASIPYDLQNNVRFLIVNRNKTVKERFAETFMTSNVEWINFDEYLDSL